MKKTLRVISNMVLPSLLFFVIYKVLGVIPAMVLSGVVSVGRLVVSLKQGNVKNSQVLGFLGLVGSAVTIIFTGNEKYYYAPALIQNVILLTLFVIMCMRHKSVLHYMAKDFDVKALKEVPEERMMNVNLLWIAFFVLKIISKTLAIFKLDFQTSYWLIFILGDPMTIIVVILSIWMIRRSFAKNPITVSEDIADNIPEDGEV
ncbi:Protein of unknown function [Lachnospiraceae bacterium G11]|nr:Protein of unknown function [Lachnospiraceae bacterium G11]